MLPDPAFLLRIAASKNTSLINKTTTLCHKKKKTLEFETFKYRTMLQLQHKQCHYFLLQNFANVMIHALFRITFRDFAFIS